MKITRIAVEHREIPLDPPFPPSWDSRPRARFAATITRVETDEGLVGVGSGDLMLGLEGHEDLFVGQDPRDLDRHFRVIENLSFHYGRCWPLDLALWDIAAQAAGLPVWRLLGGCSPRVRLYASSGVLRAPEALAEQAERFVAEGFPAMKIRFHRADWREDVQALATVRKAVGDRIAIMVDCNQGWRMPWDVKPAWTLKDALAVARHLEELDAYWMEEPLHRADIDGMASLRRMTRLRIAGGEMAREMHDIDRLIDGVGTGRAVDILQPDAAVVGGVTGLSRIARTAQARGVVFTPHTWGNGLGLLANAHLVAGTVGGDPDAGGGCPWLEWPHDPPEWSAANGRDFLLAEELTADGEGFYTLPDKPGWGVALAES